jgi:hypothetical protein
MSLNTLRTKCIINIKFLNFNSQLNCFLYLYSGNFLIKNFKIGNKFDKIEIRILKNKKNQK